MNMDTEYCNENSLVLQITPELAAGEMQINNKRFKRVASFIFIPKSDGTKIYWTPPHLNYNGIL